MLKILGVMCIFSASALIGVYFSESIRYKKERLVIIHKMLSDISDYIRWNSFTMHEIADRLSEKKEFSRLDFTVRLSENCKQMRSFPKAWENAVTSDDRLSEQEKKLLTDIGGSLGTTDVQGQLSAIAIYMSDIENMIAEESEKYRVKGKMYRSLGIAFGAMTGILII
ncbi:MAG: stage III sporulation protein AB [Oscillospiraceae bacterium]|nr:stage III sporulation protein AB [Oscillospiraceae bacterium]